MQAFIVRVWTPRDGDESPAGLRGTAVHLASGREVRFAEAAALIRFLNDASNVAAATTRGDHNDAPRPPRQPQEQSELP
jgi:hypothetical protein